MAQPLQKPLTLYDYLALEDLSQVRHEYVSGSIYAMTGGSLRHNRIAGNIFRLLSNLLDGSPCQVFINDVKLHVQAADSVYYPDVFVYCGSAIANDDKVVADATVVVEVLSDSTATIDRREKFAAYRKLEGLRAYWLVHQNDQRIEVHSRDANGHWQALAYGRDESVPMEWTGGAPVALAQVYAGTDLAG